MATRATERKMQIHMSATADSVSRILHPPLRGTGHRRPPTLHTSPGDEPQCCFGLLPGTSDTNSGCGPRSRLSTHIGGICQAVTCVKHILKKNLRVMLGKTLFYIAFERLKLQIFKRSKHVDPFRSICAAWGPQESQAVSTI